MRFDILKCHGSGNDFPMIDARGIALAEDDWAIVARALADRRGPVGGDGLLLLTQGRDGAAFAMAMYNSDGSQAETCLNGLRCVARLGFDRLGIDRATVSLKTSTAEAAIAEPLAPGIYTVRERAGPADFAIANWPLTLDAAELVDAPIPMLPGDRRYTAVAMPNPHLVAFVDSIDEAELSAIGAACEAAPAWLPHRANVSFVEQRGPDLFVRTFERGVGLTDSCGSAMAASTVAACRTGRVAFDVETTVFNKGGLVRAVVGHDYMVTLSGNATIEWEGSVAVDLSTGIAGDVVVARHHNDEIAAWAGLIDRATA